MSITHRVVAFEDFVVTKTELTFINAKGHDNPEKTDLQQFFAKYEIEVDFGFREEGDRLFAFVKISINHVPLPLYGYQIFCQAMGVVRPLEAAMEGNPKNRIEESALFFTINQVRAFILNLTGYGILGKYLLPAIDLNAVLSQKKQRAAQVDRRETKKASSKTKNTKS